MKSPIDHQLVKDFLDAFEEVFDKDWSHTKSMLGIPSETETQSSAAKEMGLEVLPIIAKDGTFVHPQVEDEVEDWGNRGRLLAAFRNLRKATSQEAEHGAAGQPATSL